MYKTNLFLMIFILIFAAVVEGGSFISVIENSTTYITCGKSAFNPVVKSKWIDPMTGADATLRERFSLTDNGTLKIRNVQRYDAGQYKCISRIKTDRGLTPKALLIYLNVEYPPTINTIEPYVRVFQNTNVVLPCSAKGNPGVTFQWRYPNKTIIADSQKYHLYTNGSLLVRNVQRKDVFMYTCTPYNDVGQGLYGFTQLDILIPPTFLDEDGSELTIEVFEGEKAILGCNATGIPKPNITWSFLNKSSSLYHRRDWNDDILKLEDIKGVEAGVYKCTIKSIAGVLKRSFHVNVIGKPTTPHRFSVMTSVKSIEVSWVPSYNGGSSQEFEIWYRASTQTDYDWETIVDNSSNHQIILNSEQIANDLNMYHYYSIRARNVEGYSDFTPVIKAKSNALPDQKLIGEEILQISKNPLEPSQLLINISSYGYNLTWLYMVTPGRPPSSHFIIEYREANSTSTWIEFRTLRRSRRATTSEGITSAESTSAQIFIKDIKGLKGPLEFQVSSVTKDNIRSIPSKPLEIIRQDIQASVSELEKETIKKTVKANEDDLIPAIVLGAIFGVFVIILIVSLYCFCRRKKRCLDVNKKDELVIGDSNSRSKIVTHIDYKDSVKTDEIRFNVDSPRHFHVRTCPALQLGKSTSNNNGGDGKHQTDDVFILIEPNENEKFVCTCNKKYFTLGHKHTLRKHSRKQVLYKSTSSPSVLLTETDEIPVTTELLVDNDFDVSDFEEDAVAELDSNKIPQLERSAFKDSLDPFCHSDSIDANFKDIATIQVAMLEKPNKISSLLKDADVSSSGTVESDILKKPRRDSDGKSSDSKSSGYGEGVPSNVSSNNYENFNSLSRFVPLISRSDTGYYSDASSRLSPSEFMNIKNQPAEKSKYATIGHHTQYFSEDEAITHKSYHRPKKPPSYKQAIVDIERMSEKSEITDSEKSFDHLLEMEKQLGVRLADPDDCDTGLTTRTLMTSRYRHSIPRNYFSDTGYMSDASGCTSKDRYTNRDKTIRCNQLLEEFKNMRKNDQNLRGNSHPLSPNNRPSLVDNIIPEEEVDLKRKLSSSSTYNEWLV